MNITKKYRIIAFIIAFFVALTINLTILYIHTMYADEYIGNIVEDEEFIAIAFYMQGFIEVGDTLFVIVKNDSTYRCVGNNRTYYIRRYNGKREVK